MAEPVPAIVQAQVPSLHNNVSIADTLGVPIFPLLCAVAVGVRMCKTYE